MPMALRHLPLVVVALLVAACSASAASPDADQRLDRTSASPTPVVATPGPSSAGPSPTLDAMASQTPSPSPAPIASTEIDGIPVFASTGLHEIRCRDQETACSIVKFADAGLPVWAVPVDGPCRHLWTSPTGDAHVACDPPSGAVLHVLDPNGRPRTGWPVSLGTELATVRWHDKSLGCGAERRPMAIASDGTAFVATVADDRAVLVALRPDGSPLPGWPRPFPGDAPAPDGFGGNGCRGFALGDGVDRVVAWGYEGLQLDLDLLADRTVYTTYGMDGTVVPGWPVGSQGAATAPAVRADGGIAYTSATGKVWAHGPDGTIRDGWPYEPPVGIEPDQISAPVGSADGALAIILRYGRTHDLVLLGPDGRSLGEAPLDMGQPIETVCLHGDTPCGGDVSPIFGPDGTLYVAYGVVEEDEDQGGSILALDRAGRLVDGWPVQLGDREHVTAMQVDLDGNLHVDGVTCSRSGCPGGGSEPLTVVIARDGRIVARIRPD